MNKLEILHLPYPRPHSWKEIVLSSALFALTVYFFLAAFQPFGTYNFYDPLKYILLIPYSLIAFLGFASADIMVRRQQGSWRLSHEALKLAIALVTCSIISYWYCATFVNKTDYKFADLIYMILFSFTLGTPISIMYLLGRYLFLRKRERNIGLPTELEEPATDTTSSVITLRPHTGFPFRLAQHDFLLAESEGNYCNVFYLDNGVPRKQLFRISLKSLEEQVSNEVVVRCHRSFIVNLGKIARAKGNAQGYQLQMEHVEALIPVSRSYIEVIPKDLRRLCSS